MSVIIQPFTLLLIIAAGYVFKRTGLFSPKDYRVLQTAEFDLILPGAIIYSFATNPHEISLLWISVYAFIAAALPPVMIFLSTRRRPVADRAFLMLNGAGFNIGCFCFPMLQVLLGSSAIIPAAMFDIGNCVMVAAGTNVITRTLLHIQPGITLSQQHAGDSPVVPYAKPTDPQAKQLARKSLFEAVAKGFLGSPSFDVYLIMIAFMCLDIHLPQWVAMMTQPFSAANAFCAMLMVGMLTDAPANRHDVRTVLEVLAWRIPCAIVFAFIAWHILPFNALIREAVVLCCLSPIAIFSTMFTDKVLGNAKLAGFTLSVTAILGTAMMVIAHTIIGA
ncbi:AEC family transporter [Bifidobacterium tsurumiense]|uniref:AEC family transporter n=1 Tax=Bifidobacterium tsurumiense TaxID=356829 RepID=UPI0012B2C006|nr:AEC family transporter [Bifidobacterium tsurumiense]MSS13271.1 permease [Bifidobacterium tsurumiense]